MVTHEHDEENLMLTLNINTLNSILKIRLNWESLSVSSSDFETSLLSTLIGVFFYRDDSHVDSQH